eukprot:6463456-Amphidinium_carterae.1
MQVEEKRQGMELQRYSKRSPTPTPSRDNRESNWYSSGWKNWSSDKSTSWHETQGESEQRQYSENSTARGSDWRPTPVPKPAPKRAAPAVTDERPVPPPQGYGAAGTLRTPRTPTPTPEEMRGTRMDYPQAPVYQPLPSELPKWAMENPHVTPRLKLVAEMGLIANHLPPLHLTPGLVNPLDAYNTFKDTVHNDYPNLVLHVELVHLSFLRILHIAQLALCQGYERYPRTRSHREHHGQYRVCKSVENQLERIDHALDYMWTVTNNQNSAALTEAEQWVLTIMTNYVRECWNATPTTWKSEYAPLFPTLPHY